MTIEYSEVGRRLHYKWSESGVLQGPVVQKPVSANQGLNS